MNKRHLNKRQLDRIQQRQKAHAESGPAGPSPSDVDSLAIDTRDGLVLSHYGQQLDIEALDGADKGSLFRCFQRSNLEPLMTGDVVKWQQTDHNSGVVLTCMPRRSLLQRPNKYNELKGVAANIDRIVIVIAPIPEPHYNLIDRYLVAAEASGILPMILLNKADLIDADTEQALDAMMALYRSLGYVTARVSCRTHVGLDTLHMLLANHTSIFCGQSGVGKSALINALLPTADLLEGSLSQAEDKGRHTTTSARLYHLPHGGDLIDSPGIREFGLWHMEQDDLLHGFIEFRPFLGHCRFRDCRHEDAAHCKLLQAVDEGHIDARRFDSWQMICNSMEVEFR